MGGGEATSLVTKAYIAILESKIVADIANQENRLLKWMVGCTFFFASIVIRITLSPGVAL